MKFHFSCSSLLPAMTVLEDELRKFDISYRRHDDGFLEIPSRIPSETRPEIDRSLSKYSIRIIEDERECLVQRIKNIIFEMVYAKKQPHITLSNYLAEKLNCSYGFLSSVFAAHTFCSIEQFTILTRTERAKRLIIEDEISLKEISEELAYSSLGHFSKQFKKTTGITLSEFRKIIIRRKNGDN